MDDTQIDIMRVLIKTIYKKNLISENTYRNALNNLDDFNKVYSFRDKNNVVDLCPSSEYSVLLQEGKHNGH